MAGVSSSAVDWLVGCYSRCRFCISIEFVGLPSCIAFHRSDSFDCICNRFVAVLIQSFCGLAVDCCTVCGSAFATVKVCVLLLCAHAVLTLQRSVMVLQSAADAAA